MSRRSLRSFRPLFDTLDERILPAALTPAQVLSAYGLNAITFNVNGQTIKGTGAGQVIAIVEAYHDPYITSDLHTFDQTFGLTDPYMKVVNLGGSITNDGWSGEESLDVEWAHAIAPGATILVVEAKSDNLWDLATAVDWVRNVPGVSTVSMSWGTSEFAQEASLDNIFTTPAGHAGVTFIAASGDAGSQGGAEWPASSANVLSVGGTTLRISPTGTYQSESLWSGTSGGASSYVSEPSYQYKIQSTGRLTSPDVSFDGDPNTGVYVYTTAPSTGFGSWEQVGGTSVCAPAWSAIIAIADQGRTLTGKGSLNGATQTLPTLFSLPSSDFHSVSTTSRGFFGSSTVTAGLGTPNGTALINGLVASTTTSATTSATVARTSVVTTASTPSTSARVSAPSASSQQSSQTSSAAILSATQLPSASRTPSIFQALDGFITSPWKKLTGAFGLTQ